MKTQKTFTIESWGAIPKHVQSTIVDVYAGKQVNSDLVSDLDSDIAFVVCDLGEAHGNLNKASKSAWLSPRNNDNTWNVSISW